ncbi:uncharacterized protein LOC115448238 [Manduca sexta]|uniref:uncharacterized protein LOC115448238 n=1 Tax=Manduca sexta TaxID=7130 RepID=UPI001183D032|nr:uncharacterized protein LOC115448238 [Manduca sexta]
MSKEAKRKNKDKGITEEQNETEGKTETGEGKSDDATEPNKICTRASNNKGCRFTWRTKITYYISFKCERSYSIIIIRWLLKKYWNMKYRVHQVNNCPLLPISVYRSEIIIEKLAFNIKNTEIDEHFTRLSLRELGVCGPNNKITFYLM